MNTTTVNTIMIMRKTTIIARPAMLTLMFCIAASTMAQGRKSEPIDKDLVGVWVMESMQFEGEKKITQTGRL